MTGVSALRVIVDPVSVLGKQHSEVLELVVGGDMTQPLAWQYLLLRTKEYYKTGFNGQIVIDFQAGRINLVRNQEIIAGGTQFVNYTERLS